MNKRLALILAVALLAAAALLVLAENSFRASERLQRTFRLVPYPIRTVSLYYYNEDIDLNDNGELDCSPFAVVPVARRIEQRGDLIEETLNELLKGEITEEERRLGFRTEFPHPDFVLLGTSLSQDGTLTLRFTEVPGFTTGGACRVTLLKAQIEKTAMQYSMVRRVRFEPPGLFQP